MSLLDSWGIIAGHLAEVPARIAKRCRRERDLRDAWSGPLGPGDPPGLRLARNTVLKYLNSPEAMHPKPRPPRGSKLDPYTEYIDQRLAEGLENCVVLLRELRTRGYAVRRCGQPNILASCRWLAPPAATCISDSPAGRPVRFTSGPGPAWFARWPSPPNRLLWASIARWENCRAVPSLVLGQAANWRSPFRGCNFLPTLHPTPIRPLVGWSNG